MIFLYNLIIFILIFIDDLITLHFEVSLINNKIY